MRQAEAASMAQRLQATEDISQPWPHAILDDFLPQSVFAELLSTLPALPPSAPVWKLRTLPESLTGLLLSREVTAVLNERHGCQGCRPMIEVAYRRSGLKPHCDRRDKPWSGLIYLAGDPVGTDLYNAAGQVAKSVEWRPNRLVCWSLRGQREQHGVPESRGRYVLVWWLLRGRSTGE